MSFAPLGDEDREDAAEFAGWPGRLGWIVFVGLVLLAHALAILRRDEFAGDGPPTRPDRPLNPPPQMEVHMPWFVVIDPACPCEGCRAWMAELQVDHVAILDPRPSRALDQLGRVSPFVQGDPSRLTEEQVERSCRGMAARFGLDPAAIRAGIFGAEGYPVRVSECCTICTDVEQGRRVVRSRKTGVKRW